LIRVLVGLVTAALAVNVSVASTFKGVSKHKHYGLSLVPQCFAAGCTKATTLEVQVTVGSAARPAADCAHGTFQLPNAKLHRDGSFTATGHASTVTTTFTLKVSGVFTSAHRVHGTVRGPGICGGSETFHLTAMPDPA
jgi:hypothetical protein